MRHLLSNYGRSLVEFRHKMTRIELGEKTSWFGLNRFCYVTQVM